LLVFQGPVRPSGIVLKDTIGRAFHCNVEGRHGEERRL
jgi:hypothetical protein